MLLLRMSSLAVWVAILAVAAGDVSAADACADVHESCTAWAKTGECEVRTLQSVPRCQHSPELPPLLALARRRILGS